MYVYIYIYIHVYIYIYIYICLEIYVLSARPLGDADDAGPALVTIMIIISNNNK